MNRATALSGTIRPPVYGLDAVRFLAAVLVVVYHLGFKAWALASSSLHAVLPVAAAFPPGYRVAWCGWIGVQVFFVVSGAVIAYSARGVSARKFAARRFARLFPALAIAVALAMPIAVALFGTSPLTALWLAVKTLAFAPWGPWIIGQFWTIPIELGFYAVIWGLLASGVRERGMHALAWLLGLASAGYWLFCATGWMAAGGRWSELLLLQHGIYFALGMVCARLGDATLALRHLALTALCLAAAVPQIMATAQWEMADRPDLAQGWPLAYAIWLGMTALVAASFLYRQTIASHVARLGDRLPQALRMAGLSTYPLYLIHINIGGATLVAAASLGIGTATLCAFVLSVLVALAIAAWFEPPLHDAVRTGLAFAGRFGSPLRRYRPVIQDQAASRIEPTPRAHATASSRSDAR
jgi:peptidoglycan/LPS O-acetylase OafA/YrhL